MEREDATAAMVRGARIAIIADCIQANAMYAMDWDGHTIWTTAVLFVEVQAFAPTVMVITEKIVRPVMDRAVVKVVMGMGFVLLATEIRLVPHVVVMDIVCLVKVMGSVRIVKVLARRV